MHTDKKKQKKIKKKGNDRETLLAEIEALEVTLRNNSDFLCLSVEHLLLAFTPAQSAMVFFHKRPEKSTMLSHKLGKRMAWMKTFLLLHASPAQALRFIPTKAAFFDFQHTFDYTIFDAPAASYVFCVFFFTYA